MKYAVSMMLGPDPRKYVAGAYGRFDYRKVGDRAVWRFETEAECTQFKKDFASYDPKDCDPALGYDAKYTSPDMSGWVF